MKERTYELTDYCPHACKYCSSKATDCLKDASFLDISVILDDIAEHGPFDLVVLSGGEPLAHPKFYDILMACREASADVVVYTNALRHIAYNANVIDGIYIEAAISLPSGVDKLRVLKRVRQGREAIRPEIKLSRNYFIQDGSECASCNHVVIRPDATKVKPCRKELPEECSK